MSSLLIDPAIEDINIINFINNNNLNLKYIINTHGHGDHIMGNNFFKDQYSEVKLLVHCADVEMLKNPQLNLSGIYVSYNPDILLQDNDLIECGQLKFKIIHTPGHTKGCICLLENTAKVLFMWAYS